MTRPRLVAIVMFAAAAVLSIPTAEAAKKVMAADCDVGGCRCMLSSLTVADVELMTGQDAPEGAADMTLVMAFGDMHWVSKSPRDVHRNFGGSGDCPIELFPGADDGPRDGIWEFVSTPADLSSCPVLTGGGAGIPVAMGMPLVGDVPITWNGGFDPTSYMSVPGEYLRWMRIDATNWRGTMFDDVVKQVSGVLTINVEARARLVDREHVHGWIDYTYAPDASGPLAALMSNSPGMVESMSCRSRAEYTGRWKSSR